MATSPYVPDLSGFSQNIGDLINRRLSEKLQTQALGGDEAAQVKLASRDPRAAQAVGSILGGRKQEAAQQREQGMEFKRRIAKSFLAAQTPDEKRNILESAAAALEGQPGAEATLLDVREDLQRFDTDFEGLNREYTGAGVLFDTQDQLKVGARKIFNDGTILQSTPQGPRVWAPTGQQLTGAEAQAQLKSAFDNEIALSGGKAGAAAQAKAGVSLETGQDIKAREERGKSKEKREQGFIDAGVEAADSMGNISRAIELLDQVETGGFDAAALRAKQLFGIESADEGELAEALGTAVLAQLKPLFGAAFTAAEGERLERISAGFGKSPAANKRILKKQLEAAERASRRAIRAAEARGDEFAADEIKAAMSRAKEVLGQVTTETPPTEAQEFTSTSGIKFKVN